MINMYEDIKGAVFGLAVGDALGVPVEFTLRDNVRKLNINKMEGVDTNFKYPTRWGDMIPKGCYSDDTAMTLATMDAYIKDYIDIKDLGNKIMNNYNIWWETGKYSSLPFPFGLGNCCSKALENYKKDKDVYSCGCTDIAYNGNGALMRILPTCLETRLHDIAINYQIEIINFIGGLTHNHSISKMANIIYYIFLDMLLKTHDKNKAFKAIINFDYNEYFDNDTIKKFEHILNKDFLTIKDIEEKENGYVVDTLEGVLFSIMNNDNFKDSVLCAINLGYDTDTLAAITGSLAGVIYGYNDIPKSWLKDLRNSDYIEDMINNFCIKLSIRR